MFWTPRILSILFILFLALFSLDIFGNGYTFWETVVGLLVHNIPSLALLVVLITSWKYDLVGGIVYILAGMLYIGFILWNVISTGFEWYYLAWAGQISGIAFFIGILFLAGWKKRKNFTTPK